MLRLHIYNQAQRSLGATPVGWSFSHNLNSRSNTSRAAKILSLTHFPECPVRNTCVLHTFVVKNAPWGFYTLMIWEKLCRKLTYNCMVYCPFMKISRSYSNWKLSSKIVLLSGFKNVCSKHRVVVCSFNIAMGYFVNLLTITFVQ